MDYKIIRGYLTSAISLSILIFVISLLLKEVLNGLSIRSDVKGYLVYLLFWTLLGLLNGLAVGAIKTSSKNLFLELLTCFVTCGIIMTVVSSSIISSYDGLFVWFLAAGIVIGLLMFAFNRIIQKYW